MKKKTKKEPHYPEEYLALAIVLLIFIEFGFANLTHASDWKAGLSVLDMSGSVQTVQSDLAFAFQPIADTISNTDLFYKDAAQQTVYLLQDDGNFELPQVIAGINAFYNQASIQMAQVLIFSNLGLAPGNVAGTSIGN